MRTLNVFNLITLDGYFTGENGDISWHQTGSDFQELAESASNAGNTLLFGRVTYEMMAGFWPSEEARKMDPVVAKGMNEAPKVVFSKKLKKVDWENTRLLKGDLIDAVRKLKRGSGKGLTLLGSGTVAAQLAEAGLIDQYDILLNPIVIGRGRSMFAGVKHRFGLKLISCRTMQNGSVLLSYQPAKKKR